MGEIKEVEVPDQFRCPISLDLMHDPVVLSTGITYDRCSIEAWLSLQSSSRNILKCPVTNKILNRSEQLISNHLLRRCIENWCAQQGNRSSGCIKEMPDCTVDTILAEINSCRTGQKLKEAMQKLKAALAKKSYTSRERNACTKIAASVFFGNCKSTMEKKESMDICEEALGVLVMVSPVDEQTRGLITGSSEAFLCMMQILAEGNSEGKTNAILIFQELAAADPLYRKKLQATDGFAEELLKLLRNDEHPTCTPAKAAIITTISYIAAEEIMKEKLVDCGVIALLLEILPMEDRSVCEASLSTLDQLCNCPKGRAAASDHPLTVPVIAQKILRVSDLAAEFAVSILWTLCRYSDSPSIVLDAHQEGLFQKLLVLVQIASGQKTKKRASQLLGLFNHYRRDDSSEWEFAKTIDFG